MKLPIDHLAEELASSGYQVPLATLQGCLDRADITLMQGQRSLVAEHLAKVERMSREVMVG